MEHKHTPGPWFENGVTVMTWPTEFDPCGYSLAHVLNPYKGAVGARDRVEANARLISAAPELLEALQEIIASADAGNAAILDSLTCKARAAIAKATGAQQ